MISSKSYIKSSSCRVSIYITRHDSAESNQMKKLLVVFSLLLVTFISPALVKAQPSSLPGVYVRDLVLDKTTYKAGDTLTGSFSFLNTETNVVPNIYYMVFLMGDYKNTIPQTQYDHTGMTGPFTLAAGENRTINFSYKLPSGISGTGLGIQVHATMQNGTGLGWADSTISVTGGTGFLKFASSYIEVGKDKFGLQDGPMVYDGERVSLNAIFNNSSKFTIDATPEISIFDRSEVGGLLKKFDESGITVKSKSDLSLNIDLPTFGFDPKVYVGKLDLLNSSGEKVAPTVDFRYIVSGNIVTINSVTSDIDSVEKGGQVALTLSYSGTPFDILNGKTATTTPSDLIIKLFNQKNAIIGEYSDKTDFNAGDKKIVSIIATEKARALRVEVLVTKDGKTLATYNALLTKDFAKIQNEPDWTEYFNLKDISLILLVIIAIIVLILLRKISHKKILVLFVLIFLLILAIVLVYITDVRAAQDTYSSGGEAQIYNLFSQVTPSSGNPGTSRTLQITANAQACSNRAMSFTISALGQSSGITRDQYDTNVIYRSLGVAFASPATPGTYSANFSAALDNFDHSNWANLTGHETFSVLCPDVTVPSVSVVTNKTCEGGLIVSWTAIPSATLGYKIFRDGATTTLATVSSSTLSFNDTSVLIGSSHSYTVQAVSACGVSAASASVSANAAPLCSIDSVVGGLSAFPSKVPGQCGGKIDVSWSAVPHATYYNVIRYNPVTGDVENTASTSAVSYRDSVTPGTTHKYAIQAFNAISHSVISALQAATATYDCTPNMVASCYATQDGAPVLNAVSNKKIVWMSPIAGGVEPYNFIWMDAAGNNFAHGVTNADTPAQATTTYPNLGSNPIPETVTISTNSGTDAYYRTASASCSVDVWNAIRTFDTKDLACNVTPSTGSVTYVNQPVRWNVTFPAGLASTTISWIGTDGLKGSSSIISETYYKVGLKNASVTVFGKIGGKPYQGTCSTSTNVVAGGAVQEQ